MCLMGALGEASDAGQDLIGRLPPSERSRGRVACLEELTNGHFKFAGAAMGTPLDLLVGQVGKDPLDLIEPRAVRGDEVDVEAGALGEPVSDSWCFVSPVVVHDEMNIDRRRDVRLDGIQELAELDRAMTSMDFTDHL